MKQLWNMVHWSRAHASDVSSCTSEPLCSAHCGLLHPVFLACTPLFFPACWLLDFAQRFRFRPLFFIPSPSPYLYFYFSIRLFTLFFVSSLSLRRLFSSYDLSYSRPSSFCSFLSRTTFSSSNSFSKLHSATWSAPLPRTKRTPKLELKNEPLLLEDAQQVSLLAVLAIPHLPAQPQESQDRLHLLLLLSLHHQVPPVLLHQESQDRRHLRALPIL